MTKEELEKEAEEWLDERYLKDMGVRKPCKQAYLASAEPREKRIAELEAYNEKLLNGDIEKHNKIVKLQKVCQDLSDKFDFQVKQVMKLEEENAELKREKEDLIFIRNQKAKSICEDKEKLTYAKTIIQDTLDNTDEYARQRAIDFLKESEK